MYKQLTTLFVFSLAFAGTTAIKAGNSNGNISTNLTSITTAKGTLSPMAYIPSDKNIYYALYAIKCGENFRPEDTVGYTSDADSAGPFQQRISEYMKKETTLGKIAFKIMGDEYDKVFTASTVEKVNAFNRGDTSLRNDINNLADRLVGIHVKTGLFGYIAEQRLKNEGIYDTFLKTNFASDTIDRYLDLAVNSQRPLASEYGRWKERSRPCLTYAYENKFYEFQSLK